MSYETRHCYHKPIAVDWQKLMMNLRSAGVSSNQIKRRVGMDIRTVSRILRGEIAEPRFAQGVELLRLHQTHCPEIHAREVYDRA